MDIISEGLLSLARASSTVYRDSKSKSLIEYTKDLRVEPVLLIEDRVLLTDYRHDLTQTLSTIFSGYYIMAASIAGNSNSVEILSTLDKLNPNRSPDSSGMDTVGRIATRMSGSLGVSTEAYAEGLPSIEGLYDIAADASNMPQSEPGGNVSYGRDTLKDNLNTPVNLAVGRVVEISMDFNGRPTTVVVNIRLAPQSVPHVGIADMLAVGQESKDFIARGKEFLMHERTVKEMTTCVDLVDAHRRALLSDTTGQYELNQRRSRRNRWATILSGNPSVATASTITVITQDTAKTLEFKLRGKLNNFKFRERIFHETLMMLLVVVDTDRDKITVYHRSIEGETILFPRDLKSNAGDQSSDVSEILKAYQMGNAPQF